MTHIWGNKWWKVWITVLLIVSVAVGAIPVRLVNASSGYIMKTTTHYKFITACVFTWGNTKINKWDPAAPGTSFTKQTDTKINSGAKNIKIYKYDPNSFDMKNTLNVEGRVNAEEYIRNYYGQSVTRMDGSPKGNANTGSLSYSWTVTLTAENHPIDVKKALEFGQQQHIIDLMGGIPKNMEEFLQERNNQGKFDENIEGLLYFVPYIIQYDLEEKIEIPKEEIRVQLGLPATAKTGESYLVQDQSYIPTDAKVKESRLERRDGLRWVEVSGWNGKSVRESADTEGTIRYRLTVTLEDGRKGTDEQEIRIIDGMEVSGEAVLSLPSVTYEGHPVIAEDISSFIVNGVNYSAVRAYEEGLASNSFSILESVGTISKVSGSKTRASAVFPTKGNYNVQLRVTPKSGGRLTDSKPIEVLKTPTVTAVLNGVQKQNRKQELNIRVATSPTSPLKELWVELEDVETGEKVRLYHNTDGKENQLNNGEYIKTRPIAKLQSDPYFTNLSLEFLSKKGQVSDYKFTVYAKDGRGMFDKLEEEFTVVPDLPPKADIEMESTFLREPGSNTAILTAKDSSETDGDQLERTWTVAEWLDSGDEGDHDSRNDSERGVPITSIPGYQDISFGSGQTVQWNKEGVGKLLVQLHVKDVWTEETLPEYIAEEDYLTGQTEKTSEVQNVAPVVTLEAIKARSAKVLFLGGSQREAQKLKESVNEMQEILLQYAVDADIRVEAMSPRASDISSGVDQGLVKQWSHSVPQGFQARNSFWEKDNFLVDDTMVYRAEATWRGYDIDCYAQLPYYIKAYDGATGNVVWGYAVNDPDLTVKPSLAQEDTGKYFFYRYGDSKTLVLDKQTGAALTTLSMSVGDYSVATTKFIYTFLPDGIHRISLSDGKSQRIHQGTISGEVRMIHGKTHFLGINGLSLHRGVFDSKTEQITFHRLNGNESDPGTMRYEAIGIDTLGKLIVRGVVTDSSSFVYYFDTDNTLLARIPVTASGAVQPVYDEAGLSNYIAYSYKDRSGSGGSRKHHTYVYICGIEGQSLSYGYSDKNGYPSVASEIVQARQFGDRIYVGNGAYWTWIYNDTYANGSRHGYPERTMVVEFDLRKGVGILNNTGEMSDREEYGKHSDTMLISKISDNNQYGGADTVTAFTWKQNVETILLRYLNRHFEDSSDDLKVIAVYDSANTGAKNSVAELAKKLEVLGIDFYYTTDIDNQTGTYGNKLAEISSGKVLSSPDTFVKDVASDMIDKKEENSWTLQLQTSKPGDGLKRTFNLDPGATYFYEYDIKPEEKISPDTLDILQMEAHFTQKGDLEELLQDEKYVVTEGYLEDFNDDETIPFFRLDKGKIKEGQFQGAYSTSHTGTSEIIHFTVPKGRKAVLSFDYDIHMYTKQAWNGNYVLIDGTRWEEFVPASQKGHYTHPNLLEPGEHTLTLRAAAYRRKGSDTDYAHTYIDNLQVNFLEEASDAPDRKVEIIPGAVQALANGWSRVTGSFRAPNQVSAYTRQKAQFLSGEPESLSVVDYPRNTSLTVNIPSGHTAIHYSMPVWFASLTSVAESDYKWTFYSAFDISDNQLARYVTGTGSSRYNLIRKDVTGKMRFTFDDSYQTGRSRPETISMVLAKPNALTRNNLYFTQGERLFVENESYSGTAELLLQPGAPGTWQIQNLRIYTIRNGSKVYLYEQSFRSDTLTRWETEGDAKVTVIKDEPGEEEQLGLVYRKGELVSYGVSYYDYEADPSKKSHWKYTHRPFNDGEHPEAAVITDELGNVVKMTDRILDKPIDRFYIDGKYTVEHWQEDDTSKGKVLGGNPDYDKTSNVESITFYVKGSGEAPWITSIATDPPSVKEGTSFKIKIGVDDKEKDVLNLTTEIYLEGKLLHTHRKEGIKADEAGNYPVVSTDIVSSSAAAGKYEVVCTVSDADGTGIDFMKFTVVTEGNVAGMVKHTDEWERNRKKYNRERFGEEVNRLVEFGKYAKEAAPRKRGTNVFWSGEAFVLEASVAGKPDAVSAYIVGHSEYSTTLRSTGKVNGQEETVYAGTLWDTSMINKWGRVKPEQLTFRFIARYPGGVVKTHDVDVIIDSHTDFWLLHRLW